jgi:hypothetical protein
MKFISIIIMIMLLSCCVENNSKNEETTPKVTDQEKEILVVIDELGINHSSSYNGTFSKVYFKEGGYSINYEYMIHIDNNESHFFLLSQVLFEKNREEAKKDFNALVKSYYSNAASSNHTTIEEKEKFLEGDDSFFAYMKNGDKVKGSIIIVRRWSRVFHVATVEGAFEGSKMDFFLLAQKLNLMDDYNAFPTVSY